MTLISDLKSRCLLCMNDDAANIPVFESHGQRKSVRKLIAEFLNVTVRESDNYPKHICERCYGTLQQINELKGCAHKTLRSLKLLQNFHHLQQKNQLQGKAEYIRSWLGSQTTEQGEISVCDQNSSNQQQSDFTCSSISANEATSSIGFNVSAVVSENSDLVNNRCSISSETAHQEKSEQGIQLQGKKRADTPLLLSTPSSRSCSPQPGALPPGSSRKQYRSPARSQTKNRSKIAVQQNGVNDLPEKDVEHSGSPQPGSLPPESTSKGSGTRKRSRNPSVNFESTPLQSKGSNLLPEGCALVMEYEDRSLLHRSRSCSPFRGSPCNDSFSDFRNRKRHRSQSQPPRPRGRPRSRSVPPPKRRKTESNVAVSTKATTWKVYMDDSIRFGKIRTECDLKLFKDRIPIVQLQRLADTEAQSRCTLPQLPSALVQTLQDFKLVEETRDKKSGILQQFCWICSKTFPSDKNMEQHLMKHRKKLKAKSSSSKNVPEPSNKSATPSVMPSVVSCNLCHVHFTTVRSLRRHMSFHSEKKWNHKCKECKETFRTRITLERHMLNHNIRCQVCDSVFTTIENLECHRKCHDQQEEYTCSFCLQHFSSEEGLRKHMVQHRKCTLCNKMFIDKNELAAHVGECHKVCSICDETVADEEELESHIETSHKKCNLCREQFLNDDELSAHISRHPYPCLVCLSAFNDKAQRNEHIKQSHQDMLELVMKSMAKEKTAE